MKRVLCLSGGVRGMAQIMVLRKLEQEFGKPLHEVYDLVAGTSVGAINAGIIASGKVSMDEAVELYPDLVKKVFKKRGFFKKPKYDRKNFLGVWNDLVGSDITMSDVKTNLMITSVDLVSDTNIFFKSWHNDVSDTDLSEIVMRSFAAPLYFGQMPDSETQRVYSDGGVGYSNLPLNEVKLQAESFGWYDSEKCGDTTVQFDCIGTLYNSEKPNFDKVAKQSWVRQVADFMNPKEGGLARAQSADDQIRMMKYISKHNKNIKFRYWDTDADPSTLVLDGVKYVPYYRRLGEEMSNKPLIELP